jgi:hypothetical protein
MIQVDFNIISLSNVFRILSDLYVVVSEVTVGGEEGVAEVEDEKVRVVPRREEVRNDCIT